MQLIINSMASAIVHRGPDDYGSWLDTNRGIAFGHRRLSILDLSAAGHQPMISNCGKLILIFNGEVYNHLDLRDKLKHEGHDSIWRGHSDTETLLACFAVWGVEKTLQSSTGMFALALWDREQQRLTLARDRFGEKPLYYGTVSDAFVFASELKSIKKYPQANLQIDRKSISFLLSQSNIPAPHTIYQHIKKLLPGHYIQICTKKTGAIEIAQPQPFWSLAKTIEEAILNPFLGSENEAVDLIERSLGNSVSQQMLSDVPVGVFLSGGIDSSVVATLMQRQSSKPINTFTIGFNEGRYNEAIHAKAIAKHLGTNHTELYISPTDAIDVIPKLPSMFCEPFSDSSQIPTYLVSQLARKNVTVALSGDGGDELFCGYTRYMIAMKQWRQIKKMPVSARSLFAKIIQDCSTNLLPHLKFLNGKQKLNIIYNKINALSSILDLKSDIDFYRRMTFKSYAGLLTDSILDQAESENSYFSPYIKDLAHQMMWMDSLNYLPNDILVKVDRAAMANSLETRIPFLNHDLVRIAWSMPLKFKIRDGKGKWLLRQILYRYIPQELIDRPKWGFGIPLDSWIRGPLREWSEALLNESKLDQDGFFQAKAVRRMYQEHITGKQNHGHSLWDILMFQAWKEC